MQVAVAEAATVEVVAAAAGRWAVPEAIGTAVAVGSPTGNVVGSCAIALGSVVVESTMVDDGKAGEKEGDGDGSTAAAVPPVPVLAAVVTCSDASASDACIDVGCGDASCGATHSPVRSHHFIRPPPSILGPHTPFGRGNRAGRAALVEAVADAPSDATASWVADALGLATGAPPGAAAEEDDRNMCAATLAAPSACTNGLSNGAPS